MEYTLTGAADATGISKTTLFRAIKSGKISARRLDDKTFRIDASELARVYPVASTERSAEVHRNVPQQEKQAKQTVILQTSEAELAALRAELDGVKAQLNRERETVDDLRKRLDADQEERRMLQRRLIPPEKPQAPAAASLDLLNRLEEAEKRIATLSALPPADKPSMPSAIGEPMRTLRGLVGRFWGSKQ